jgi:DNA-binding NtrC family response regulator
MKTHIVAALLVLAGLSDPLLACGEKFLMGSRGTRFHQPAPVRQSATILVYANPVNLTRALANVPLEATLLKAGYRPTVVTSADAFDNALSRGGWDLVLVDVADSPAVSRRAPGANAPIVLPVLYNPTGAELAAAKKQHQHILKAPTKNQAFLDAIDDALATPREKAGR